MCVCALTRTNGASSYFAPYRNDQRLQPPTTSISHYLTLRQLTRILETCTTPLSPFPNFQLVYSTGPHRFVPYPQCIAPYLPHQPTVRALNVAISCPRPLLGPRTTVTPVAAPSVPCVIPHVVSIGGCQKSCYLSRPVSYLPASSARTSALDVDEDSFCTYPVYRSTNFIS